MIGDEVMHPTHHHTFAFESESSIRDYVVKLGPHTRDCQWGFSKTFLERNQFVPSVAPTWWFASKRHVVCNFC